MISRQPRDHGRALAQRRLACDRCHVRKLRCWREIQSPQCSRCIQDGCLCTYSPPLKSGRPKKISYPQTSGAMSTQDITGNDISGCHSTLLGSGIGCDPNDGIFGPRLDPAVESGTDYVSAYISPNSDATGPGATRGMDLSPTLIAMRMSRLVYRRR